MTDLLIDLREIVQRAKDKDYISLAEAFDDYIYDLASHSETVREYLRSESWYEEEE